MEDVKVDILHDIEVGNAVEYKGKSYLVLDIDYLCGGVCKEVCLVKKKKPFFGLVKPIYLYDQDIRELKLIS